MITDDGTARAKFHVKYDCIAFRPFKGEVLDAGRGFHSSTSQLNLSCF
jgi:hypothetical protein